MSSFLPTVTGPHICLRCRLRLANGRARPQRILRSSPTEHQSRRLSVKAQQLQEHVRLDKSSANEQSLLDNTARFPVEATLEKDDIKLPNDVEPKKASKKSGYYFKRANLYSRDSLGVTTLGRPAEVLRVQDAPPRSSERKWWLFEKEGERNLFSTETLTSADILQRVISERGIVSAERVRANIEAAKQEWLVGREEPDRQPSKSECYELKRKLHDGFAIKQLLGYYNGAKLPETTDMDDLSRPFRSSLLIRSEWRAGLTPFPGDALHRLQPFDAEPEIGQRGSPVRAYTENMLLYESRQSKDPVKHIIVNKILRQCWNIKPKEELEAIGELDVRMPEAHLKLMTTYAKDILRQVADEYDVKIDFSKVVPVLRITSTQPTCISTLKLISMVLDEIACCEMPLRPIGDSKSRTTEYRTQLNDRLLSEIERLSSAVICWPKRHGARKGSDEKLLIYSLPNRRKSLEDAQKFISQALRPTNAAVVGSFFGGTQAMPKTLLPVPVEAGQGLPLVDRGTAWIRKVTASDKRATDGQDVAHGRPTPTFRTSQALTSIQNHIQTSNAWGKASTKHSDYPFWFSDVYQETSAVPGRLLYPAKTATYGNDGGRLFGGTAARCVFSTDLPSLRWSLSAQEITLNIKEELFIRLSAVTKQGSGNLENASFPDLELRFRVRVYDSAGETYVSSKSYSDDTDSLRRHAALKRVRLILERKEADLLLPHEQADVRFHHQAYINAKDDTDPSIKSFIKASKLHGPDVDLIETPQLLTIGLPRQILFPGRDIKESEDSEIAIDYSPTSIERQYVLENSPGLNPRKRLSNLAYAIIDAGLIGGRRQELRFFADGGIRSGSESTMNKNGTTDERKSTVKALYKSAIDMIHSLGTEAKIVTTRNISNRTRRRMRRVIQGHRGTPVGQKILKYRFGDYVPHGRTSRVRRRLVRDNQRRRDVDSRRVVWTGPIRKVHVDPK
ncbi:MAG: hypothetical protein Q9184_000634 [Pyrenodesmia sp. 2 TL-2023]